MNNIGYHLLRIGLWGFLALLNAFCAAFITLIAALIYEWAIPDPSARFFPHTGLSSSLKYFGWTKGLIVFGLSFLIISYLYHLRSKNFDQELHREFLRNEADLKLVFGSDATIEPHGIGYKAMVSSGPTQFEANCYSYSSRFEGISTKTATSAVTFPIADRTFEMNLVQKWGWASPKQESTDVAIGGNLFDILQARYDIYCSHPHVIQALIADPAVQREILPINIPEKDRFKVTIKGGRASVDCTTEPKHSGKSGRAEAYVLMKKMIVRAQVFDSALSRILKDVQKQDV